MQSRLLAVWEEDEGLRCDAGGEWDDDELLQSEGGIADGPPLDYDASKP